MQKNSEAFEGLTAEFYDNWFTSLDKDEYQYYRKFVESSPGPVLEAACGTGRLLIPLAKEGYSILGADASQEMLNLCAAKAEKLGVPVELHCGMMQSLELPIQFGGIFVALGSFQLIQDKKDAQAALNLFHQHLICNGKLSIYLFAPWAYPVPPDGGWNTRRNVDLENRNYKVIESCKHDLIEQLISGTLIFEETHEGISLRKEVKQFCVRWYSRFEFESMLREAGFETWELVPCNGNAHAKSDAMIFTAKRT